MSFEAPKSKDAKDGWTQVTNPSPSANFQVHVATPNEKMEALKTDNPFTALHPDEERKAQEKAEGPQPVERVKKEVQSDNPFAALNNENDAADKDE